jgi:putative membrane protein
MKHAHISAAVLAAAGLIFVARGPAIAAQNTHSDAMFAREAATANMTEIELGRLAVQKSSNDKLKEFGQRMINDHTKANDNLKSIATKDSINLPADLDAKHRALVNRFSNMSGTEFDRMYASTMVSDHESAVALFGKEADHGSNPDLKAFASDTLPTLREHLRLAQENESAGGVTSRK